MLRGKQILHIRSRYATEKEHMRLPIQLLNQTGITCLSMISFTSQGTHTFWFFLTKDFGPRKSGILMRIVVFKIMFINLIETLLSIYVFDIF